MRYVATPSKEIYRCFTPAMRDLADALVGRELPVEALGHGFVWVRVPETGERYLLVRTHVAVRRLGEGEPGEFRTQVVGPARTRHA